MFFEVTSDSVSAALKAQVKLVGQLVVIAVAPCANAIPDHPSADKHARAATNLFIDNFTSPPIRQCPWIRPCTARDVKSIAEIARLSTSNVI